MKSLFGALTALAIVAGLGWTGGYLYWHIRLVGALRTLETRSGPQGTDLDAVQIVQEAGCKALPYLIGAIQPGKNPFFLAEATKLLKLSLQGPVLRGDYELYERSTDWLITPETMVEERQKKCDDLHAWWREKGEARHSGATWWRHDCGGV